MELLPIFAIALLIVCQAWAFHDPELKAHSSGYYRRRAHKVAASDGYKLPGNARPSLYEVTLTLTPNDYEVIGEVLITLDVDPSTTKEKTTSLQLNAALNFNNFSLTTFTWNDSITCELGSFGNAFINITCPESIEGTDQKLKITYVTNYASFDQYGMYIVNYVENNVSKSMVATQLEQDYARRLFPCFDEPEYKAPIKLTLKTNTSEYDWSHWISNTKVASETIDGTTVTTTFETTPIMSAYLLAFVATPDFKNYSIPDLKADYGFEIFAKPTAENYVSIALENGPNLIDLMGKFTGITYKSLGNDRMVFAAIPEFTAGAMENWGLITFREQILIDEGENTTARDKQNIITTIAHELAHQWFGDYVTLDWWSETWLNEGFATYFEYYLADQLNPDFNMLKQLVIKEKQRALKTDSSPDSMPLSNNASDVTSNTDFWAEFGDISYSKGGSIISLIHQTMGDAAFKSGLHEYLHKYNHSKATSQLLLDALQTAAPKDVDLNKLFKEWIYESGYPLLDVSILNNTVTVTANKFSSSLDKSKENNTAIWWIPLTYTTSEKADFNLTSLKWVYSSDLSSFSANLTKDDSWIIFNLQSIGYYRVNYDQTLWDRIITVLNSSKTYLTINVLNRAQLIDDIFNVAKFYQSKEENGTLYYSTAFKLAEYLQYETEYYPWYTFLTEMQYLMEIIQDDLTLSALKEKILGVISPQLAFPNDTDALGHTEILKRNLLLTWACRLGHENCTQWAQEKYEVFRKTESIDPNYRDVILCTGLSLANNTPKAEFLELLNIMENSILPNEQLDIIKALTCSKKDDLIQRLLRTTIDYIPNEAHFSRMYNDRIIQNLLTEGSDKVKSALSFALTYDNDIIQYWQQIEDEETLVKKIAAKIYNQENIDIIDDYIAQHINQTEYADRIKVANQAIEIAKKNIEYRDQYSTILTSVIVYNGGPTTTTTVAPPETTPAKANKMTYNIVLATILVFSVKYILY